MAKLTLEKSPVAGRRVVVRVDFNVPLDKGKVADDARIRASIPTIKLLMEKEARIVLMSHLGRPKGKPDRALAMDPVAQRLSELLDTQVPKLDGCIEDDVVKKARQLAGQGPVLLENLRFYPGEEKDDPEFANGLARHGEIFVNDAFGAAHRAHASVHGIARFLPAVAGLLMAREIDFLSRIARRPEPPFVAVLGGAKVSDKLKVLDRLAQKADKLLVGGAMAFTFLAAKGLATGTSLVEQEQLDHARRLIDQMGPRLVLPVDCVVAAQMKEGAQALVVDVGAIPAGQAGYDIGPRTVELFARELTAAHTVFWNGPMGVFEMRGFDAGTEGVARALAGLSATTVVGGGDSAAALARLGLADKVTHLSTGGGASLEFIEGEELPGVAVLAEEGASI